MWIAYKCRFDDNSVIFGISGDLNQSLKMLKKAGKKKGRVTIIHYSTTEIRCREALARADMYYEYNMFYEHKCTNNVILNPMKLLQEVEAKESWKRHSLLRNRLQRLTNKYINTFLEYQKMLDNIHDIDGIVAEALQEARYDH